MEKIQYTLNIPIDVYEGLQNQAEEEGISVATILRRGMKLEGLLTNVRKNGGRILIEKDKTAGMVEIVPL